MAGFADDPDRVTETDPKSFRTYRRGWVRAIATSFTGEIAAFVSAERKGDEHLAYRFTLGAEGPDRCFRALWDDGGQRLAISRDGQLLVAGTYHVHGVRAYETKDGSVLWERTDLKKVQQLALGDNDRLVLVSLEEGGCHVLDARDGATVFHIRGARAAYPSIFDDAMVVWRRNALDVVRLTTATLIKRQSSVTFGLLGAYSAPGVLIAAEASGPLRAFECIHGAELWNTRDSGRMHYLRLTYASRDRCLWAIGYTRHEFDQQGCATLWRIDPWTGEHVEMTKYTPDDPAFPGPFVLEGSSFLGPRFQVFPMPAREAPERVP